MTVRATQISDKSIELRTRFGRLKYDVGTKAVWWADGETWANLPQLVKDGTLRWHSDDGFLIEPRVAHYSDSDDEKTMQWCPDHQRECSHYRPPGHAWFLHA